MKKYLLLLIIFTTHTFAFGQPTGDMTKITAFHKARQNALLKEYVSFLSIPNTMNDPADLAKNARFIADMMTKSGIKSQLLTADVPGIIPAVYGEVMTPGATTTLIFYAHYDGQPVTPKNWAEGLEPFVPRLATNALDKGGTLRAMPKDNEAIDPNWRIYARAAADDKAGVFTIINAYDAIRQSGLKPTVNIKFFFEGEEEKGSTNLGAILEKHKNLLKGDMWIIADGPLHASGRKQIVFGVRGDVNMHVTVYGPKRPLHSGNYGNWAPNPALKLVQLLSSMKDTAGRVLIEGFYDDVTPLSKIEREALAAIPDPAPMMQKELNFAQAESQERTFLESITTLPTLNINGILSANVGKLAANIIPTTATATLDLRLVKGNDAQKQINKVIAHIRKQGYYVLDREPTEAERATYANIATIKAGTGYNAQRTSMDLPLAQRVIKAVQGSSTESVPTQSAGVVLMPSAGGSLPLYLFESVLNTPPITVPVVNYDNNQHGENENLRVGCLFQGIETIAAIMMMK